MSLFSGSYELDVQVQKSKNGKTKSTSFKAKRKRGQQHSNASRFLDSFDEKPTVEKKKEKVYPRPISESEMIGGGWKALRRYRPIYVAEPGFGHCLAMYKKGKRHDRLAIIPIDLFKDPYTLRDGDLKLFEIKDIPQNSAENRRLSAIKRKKMIASGELEENEDSSVGDENEDEKGKKKEEAYHPAVAHPLLMFYFLGEDDGETSSGTASRQRFISSKLMVRNAVSEDGKKEGDDGEGDEDEDDDNEEHTTEMEHPNMKILRSLGINPEKVGKKLLNIGRTTGARSSTAAGEEEFEEELEEEGLVEGYGGKKLTSTSEANEQKLDLGPNDAALISSKGEVYVLSWDEIRERNASDEGNDDIKQAVNLLLKQHVRMAFKKFAPQKRTVSNQSLASSNKTSSTTMATTMATQKKVAKSGGAQQRIK